jgi:hypothetical protein
MDARLVTSSHKYVVPKVRELPSPVKRAEGAPLRRPITQRELVAASLIATKR